MIETVSEQRLRELFVTMLEKYPSLVFDVLEPAPDRPDHGHPPPAGEGVPDWCICGKCRIMRKTIEEVCCRKATCLTLLAVSQLYVCVCSTFHTIHLMQVQWNPHFQTSQSLRNSDLKKEGVLLLKLL